MSFIQCIKHMLRLDLKKGYVSSMDQFLADFDKKHPNRSKNQLREIEKHQRIANLRDNQISGQEDSKPCCKKESVWENF